MSRLATSRASQRESYKLNVSTYDRASSLLLSLLVIVGCAVGGLLIVFFARQFTFVQRAVEVKVANPGERTPDAAQGLKEDIEPPGLEEAPELDEPQLQETLNALSNAVSSRQAILSDESIDSNANASNKGNGFGDARKAGSGSGDPIREPRREVRFEPASLAEYARFLDAYEIELVVWGSQDGKLYYASKLANARPTTRVLDNYKQDQRLTMRNLEGGKLYPLDRQLARKAGISDKGRVIWHAYPPNAAGLLLDLEKKAAGETPLEALQLTAFRVAKSGDRFTFSVEEQQ